MAPLSKVLGRCILPLVVWTTVPVIEEAHADVLSAIARCESGGQQYDAKGRVLRNRLNPSVVGVFQINERDHAARARQLGLNIYSREGNWAYARYLLRAYGTTPWLASRQCWQIARQ